jgi:hypothetical protein
MGVRKYKEGPPWTCSDLLALRVHLGTSSDQIGIRKCKEGPP